MLQFDGYVAQYLGDGVLAYFGYPVAHEEDAQRAVRAGLGLLEAIDPLNTRLALPLLIEWPCGWDIPAWCRRRRGKGPPRAWYWGTRNIAARLQQLAAPNTLVISAATYHLIEGYFTCEALEEQPLRGRAQPLRVYRVLRANGVQSRFEVAAARGRRRWWDGHQVELLVERWERVKTGMGQVVVLAGEAGIGKSRLVQVLKEHVASEGHLWLECQGSPYYQHTALYPLTELLARRLLPVEHEATAAQQVHHLEGLLVQHGLPSMPLCRYRPSSSGSRLCTRSWDSCYAWLPSSRSSWSWKTCTGVDPSTLEWLSLWWIRPDHPHPGPVHLSAGLPSAVGGALASHPDDAGALAPASGHRTDAPGGAGQGATSGGGRADRGQDRWGATVRRGANQDGAGIRPAPGAGGSLRAHQPLPPLAIPATLHDALLAAGPPGGGKEPRATRGDAGA